MLTSILLFSEQEIESDDWTFCFFGNEGVAVGAFSGLGGVLRFNTVSESGVI